MDKIAIGIILIIAGIISAVIISSMMCVLGVMADGTGGFCNRALQYTFFFLGIILFIVGVIFIILHFIRKK